MAALGVTGVAPETVALWDAVDDGDEAKVREVVAAGASTSAANRMGLSSLHRAAAAGSVSIATVLAAELGAPIDKPDRAGSTALVVAAGRGHEAVVRALLRLGADVSPARDDGTRALHLACAGGHVGSALAIVRARGGDAAGAGAKDKQGCTPAEHLAQASARNADPADLTELRALLAAAEAATPGPPSAEADTDPPASPPPSPPPPVPPARSAAVTPPPAAPSTEAAALDETEAPAAPNGRQPPPLTPAEGRRYSRHLLLPQVAVAGQLALKRARVLVVGAGGLGSPVLLYLAAAGVGELLIADHDEVDESNLQRQVVHSMRTLGVAKVDSAAEALRALNPHVRVRPLRERLCRNNARRLVKGADVVMDCTDSLTARYAVADACAAERRPLVYGAVSQFEGHVSVFRYDLPGAVGYRDLYPKCPPAGAVANCASAGVLGVLPAVVGSLQATEALKLILQLGRTLDGSLLLYSALDMSFVELPIGKRDLPTGEGLWKLGAREAAEAAEGGDGCAMGGSLEPIKYIQTYEYEYKKTRRLPAPEAAVRMAAGWRPFVLDVRAERESLISSLPGTHLRRAHDALFRPGLLLPSEGDVLVYCRSGARSLLAIAELARAGLVSAERLVNLDGGVNAWAELVDPTMLQY